MQPPPRQVPTKKKKFPYKTLLLATVLFLGGSVMVILGSLLLAGIIETPYWDRGYSLIVLGSIMFIPGFWAVRIFYYASKKVKGFHYRQVPDFD